jgi:hypothetical protein
MFRLKLLFILYFVNKTIGTKHSVTLVNIKTEYFTLKFKMVKFFMEKEICGTFHAKCGTRDLT